MQAELLSLLQRSTLQLQPAVVSRLLDLHPQELLPTVPVPNQEVFLRHKGPSTLIHPQQVGEGLAVAQRIKGKSHKIRNDRMMRKPDVDRFSI